MKEILSIKPFFSWNVVCTNESKSVSGMERKSIKILLFSRYNSDWVEIKLLEIHSTEC
jgi:hypothetical protein